MGWFDNLGLRNKLIFNFFISGGIFIVAIIFCILQIIGVGKHTDEISTKWLPSIQSSGELSQLRLRYRVRSLEYMLPGSADERDKIKASLSKLDEALTQSFTDYEKFILGDEERSAFNAAKEAAANYRTAVNEAITLSTASKENEAQELRKTA